MCKQGLFCSIRLSRLCVIHSPLPLRAVENSETGDPRTPCNERWLSQRSTYTGLRFAVSHAVLELSLLRRVGSGDMHAASCVRHLQRQARVPGALARRVIRKVHADVQTRAPDASASFLVSLTRQGSADRECFHPAGGQSPDLQSIAPADVGKAADSSRLAGSPQVTSGCPKSCFLFSIFPPRVFDALFLIQRASALRGKAASVQPSYVEGRGWVLGVTKEAQGEVHPHAGSPDKNSLADGYCTRTGFLQTV